MEQLNNDCMYSILSYIPIENLINTSSINKQYNVCYKSEMLWKLKVHENYKDFIKKNTWFETYVFNNELLYLMKITKTKSSREDFLNSDEIFLYQKIKIFPKTICYLKNLKILDLTANTIAEIPKEIGNLINLQKFRFPNNSTKVIPKEIGNLINLQEFSCSNNEIKDVPKEIGNLINLYSLSISFNPVNDIPKEIGNLINLHSLYLCHNKINGIPKFL